MVCWTISSTILKITPIAMRASAWVLGSTQIEMNRKYLEYSQTNFSKNQELLLLILRFLLRGPKFCSQVLRAKSHVKGNDVWPMHSKNKLLTVKRFLSLLNNILFKISIKGNPLTVKGLSFQMLSFYCQIIFSCLEMKSFVVKKIYNFEDKRKKLVCNNLIRNVKKPIFEKC